MSRTVHVGSTWEKGLHSIGRHYSNFGNSGSIGQFVSRSELRLAGSKSETSMTNLVPTMTNQ